MTLYCFLRKIDNKQLEHAMKKNPKEHNPQTKQYLFYVGYPSCVYNEKTIKNMILY